nr:Chain B, Cellular tumor antigen p53 [Homo sapiens]
HSSHLKSKKGQ